MIISAIDLQRLRRNDKQLESIELRIDADAITTEDGNHELAIVTEALKENTKLQRVAIIFFQHFSSHSSWIPTPISRPIAVAPVLALDADQTSNCQRRQDSASTKKKILIEDLLEAIGALPKLREVSIVTSGGLCKYDLSVSALIALLQQAGSQLQGLQLSGLHLVGTPQSFVTLVACFQYQTTNLQAFTLEECKIVHDFSTTAINSSKLQPPPPLPPTHTVDSLLQALASIPTIRSIHVVAKRLFDLGILTSRTMEHLASSTSLQRLVIKGFLLKPHFIHAMAPNLARPSSSLKEISLPKCHYPTIIKPSTTSNSKETNTAEKLDDCLIQMLQHNKTLEWFDMQFISTGCSGGNTSRGCTTGATPTGDSSNNNNPVYSCECPSTRLLNVAAKVLETNTKLAILNLGLPFQQATTTATPTIAAAPQGPCRTSSNINYNKDQQQQQQQHMLNSKHRQTVVFYPGSHCMFIGVGKSAQVMDDIRFQLKLNQAGRSQFLQDASDDFTTCTSTGGTANPPPPPATVKDWVHAMEHVTDELSCVYYFLSLNPALYANAALL